MKRGERRLNFREPHHYRPSTARRLLHAALLAGAIWFFGLLIFAASIPAKVRDPATKTDAIVVLTGGGERLTEAFDLLSRGLAPRLYISGIAAGVDLTQVAGKVAEAGGAMPDEATMKCCVTVDRAQNTAGNAVESAQWITEQKIASIRLVTANYHMNRSLLEFRRAIPGLQVVPNPVFPPEIRDAYWFVKPRILVLLVNEYHKYLVAAVRAQLGTAQAATHSAVMSLRSSIGNFMNSAQALLAGSKRS
jgi:uncharacterized SAM-binding protein YcdF (DUF218 family)